MTQTAAQNAETMALPPQPVSFWQAFAFWLKLGFISFGGPARQISIMHQELVERRRWISERRFLYALNYCMLLPDPEAQQLATYIGWLMHRTWFTFLPSFLFILAGGPLVEPPHNELKFTAAVVGVILNLALFFGYHVLWRRASRGLSTGLRH